MPKNEMSAYLYNDGSKKNELEGLPDQIKAAIQAHLELYLVDPEKAHIWDPIVVGVPYGPVKSLLLTYTGRKSGKRLQTVLQYFNLDGKTAIVGSRGGTVEHPLWYLNLLANPNCEIQIGKVVSPAVARTVEGEERARWWELITKEQPEQLKYESRTSRTIPVVVFDLPHVKA